MTTHKAHKVDLFSFKTIHMRTFHLTWMAFFICFFGWFSHAPLMASTISKDLNLTRDQIIIAFMGSVGITVIARLFIGYLCDRIGPRMAYVALLVFGAVAVSGSALAYDWPTYLLSRLAIGIIGASFVITQYHTSKMFAPNVVGIANATTAGWGNLGGGVTQAIMPIIAAVILALGLSETEYSKWRLAMVFPAVAMLIIAFLYWKLTTDLPEGNYKDLPDKRPAIEHPDGHLFFAVLKDYRVWVLFLIYAGCFGMELFVNGRAATYYQQRFSLGETVAGVIASMFGMMNIFARSMGGLLGDRFAKKTGLTGRVRWLVIIMTLEGIALVGFSQLDMLPLSIAGLIIFSLAVQMAEGATFSVVPFINKRSLGAVTGIVGAGGNVGAVLYAQFLMNSHWPLQDVFHVLGYVVVGIAILGFAIRFPQEVEESAHREYHAAASLT